MATLGGIGSGAGTGAALGSIVPGVGTLIGAGIGAAFGGISSIFSDASQSKAMNEAISRAQALAAQGLISNEALSARLHSIDRQFNARLTSVLNVTAIRSRGIANSGTVGAAVAGAMEGSREASKAGVIEQSLSENKGIRMAMAQMELSRTGTDPVGAFIEGAAAGGMAGAEIGKLAAPREIPSLGGGGAQQGIGVQGPQTGPLSMDQAGTFNPFLRSQDQRIGNLEGTQTLNYVPQQGPFMGNVDVGRWGFNG